MDFAQARYFSSGLGRFSSPDNFLNDTRVSDPGSWNLYVYVRNNPLILIDPDGEKIYVGDITDPKDREKFLKRVNATYGCDSCVSIDDNGYLELDQSQVSEDILNATQFLTNAINSADPDLMFQVTISNNDPNIEFAKSTRMGGAGAGAVPYIGPDGTPIQSRNGNILRRAAHRITLDFGDDSSIVGGSEEVRASWLDFVFAHEVSHFSPIFARDPSVHGQRGVVDNPINEIRLLQGRPLRAQYLYRTHGKLNVLKFGQEVRDASGNVVRGADGIEVETNRVLIWMNRQR